MKIGYPDTINRQEISPLKDKGHPGDEEIGHGHKGEIEEGEEGLKTARENRRAYQESKPWKKNESRTEDGKPQWYKEGDEWVESEQYETRSEYNASMQEEDEAVERAEARLKAARERNKKGKTKK